MDQTIGNESKFTNKLKGYARSHSALLALFGVLIIIVIFTSISSDVFFTAKNFRNILIQVSVLAVLAAGTTMLMVSGGIDLSIGAMMSFVGVVAGLMMINGIPLWISILGPLLLAALLGMMNGTLAAWSPSHPFVVTLGVSILFQGLAIGLSDGKPLSGLYQEFVVLSRTDWLFNLTIPVWIAFAILLATGVVLNFMVFGRHLYSLGGNQDAAYLAGVRVKLTKIALYSLNGLLVGLAALMLSARISSAQPWMGTGYELTAIAAVAVGGTPLAGGRGNIVGTLLGVLLLGLISNSLNLLGISGAYQYVLQGLVIVFAVMTQQRQ